jgi:hypothetical protein
MFQMFLLLYADDTVICAESERNLQECLDKMHEYCLKWKMVINVTKTKVIVFSRGKIRKKPKFTYNDKPIDVVFDVMYLGIQINYNNKFSVAQKNLYDRASRAMFALLRTCRQLSLPVDIQIDLFDKMIAPILVYGCEIWGFGSCELAIKLQLRFYKIVFRLKKSTPNIMVFGELGKYPLDVNIKCKMLCYWFKLINPVNKNKLSSIMYRFTHKLYMQDMIASDYLSFIENTLNEIGLSGFWILQENFQHSPVWFKEKVKRGLYDQYIQKWFSEIGTKDIFWNYRMYKDMFVCEDYITNLSYDQCISLIKFRTINNNLPVQKERYANTPRAERICTKCTSEDIGDEFHYLFVCDFFKDERIEFLPPYYWKKPSALKYKKLFSTKNRKLLIKLLDFIKLICNTFS